MVGTVKRWLGIDVLQDRVTTVEAENLRLARAILALEKRVALNENAIDAARKESLGNAAEIEDYEARIAFCESHLTQKPSEAKIVPKAHKTTYRQFAEAASKATEEIEA